VNGARRYFQNQDRKKQLRYELTAARCALDWFRRNNNPQGFPNLRSFLMNQSMGFSFRRFGLDGYGRDDMGLTEAEYDQFKEAYKATEAGAAETTSYDPW
jgi:hypothetical protein